VSESSQPRRGRKASPSSKPRPASKPARGTAGGEVDAFVADCRHPLLPVLEALRAAIRAAAPQLQEGIKWNAPSFASGGDDRITTNLSAKDRVRVVFHCGAKKRAAGAGRVDVEDHGLLEWAAHDRGIATFRSVEEVAAARSALAGLVRDWIAATTGKACRHMERCVQDAAMMLKPTDVHPITECKRSTPEFVKRLRATGQPDVLAIDGRGEIVVQHAAAYERLLAIVERAEAVAGVRKRKRSS
jgi:hypothetical protein